MQFLNCPKQHKCTHPLMQISIKSFLEVQHKKTNPFLSGKSGEELKIFILGGALGVFGLNSEVVADLGVKKKISIYILKC